MAESGQGYYFQNGIWLNRGETSRSDKFQKWTDDKMNSKVEQLDKQRHVALVRLNSECLQMRAQLRGLKEEKRQFRKGSDSQGSLETDASVRRPPASFPNPSRATALKKPAACGSPSQQPAVAPAGRVGEGAGRRNGSSPDDDMAGRIKSVRSSRNLSRLKNEMEVRWK